MKQLQANKEQLVETVEQIEIKYFYSNGVEIKRHDLVYLKAYDTRQDALFSGICKVAGFDGEVFSAYFLGQEVYITGYDVEVYRGDIERLVKLESKEIDEALNKTVKKLQLEIGN